MKPYCRFLITLFLLISAVHLRTVLAQPSSPVFVDSQVTHVALYINQAYYGLYIMVEHVDEQFLKKYFEHPGGNLWKCLWPADLTYRGNDPQNYFLYYDYERPYNLKTNRQTMDFEPLARLIRVLGKTANDYLTDSLAMLMDLNDVLKYFPTNLLVAEK